MTVLAKSKSGVARIRRHREGLPGRRAARGTVAPATSEQTVTDEGTADSRRRREAGVSEDHAIYTCQCGLVFEALVSTTVSCPHCGGSQAW